MIKFQQTNNIAIDKKCNKSSKKTKLDPKPLYNYQVIVLFFKKNKKTDKNLKVFYV